MSPAGKMTVFGLCVAFVSLPLGIGCLLGAGYGWLVLSVLGLFVATTSNKEWQKEQAP